MGSRKIECSKIGGLKVNRSKIDRGGM